MIRFALSCEEGHEFDAWFASGSACDEQIEAGVILCPACGSGGVRKAPMAPAVLKRRGRAGKASPRTETQQADGVNEAEQRQTYAFLRGLKQHLKANADDVGKAFAREARKMHFSEAEERSIYGEATLEEAKALNEEGIPAFPLPKLPEDHN